MELGRAIAAVAGPLQRKIRLMLTRGVVKLIDPSTLLQELQVVAVGDEVLDRIEHWEQYGYTSHPKPGSEALLAAIGGDRDHLVVVSVADRRFRLKGLAEGEVALYSDEGDVIHFKRGKELLVQTGKLTANASVSATITTPLMTVVASTKVVMTTPLVEASGDLAVAGAMTALSVAASTTVTDAAGTMQDMRDTYNSHNHDGGSGPVPGM